MLPYLFHAGHLYLPTLGTLSALGLLLGLVLSLRTSALTGVSPDALWDAGLFAVLAAYGLSRLLLVAFQLHSFLAFPWLLLAVPSFTPTGLLLTALATCLWLRWKRIQLLPVLDAWAPCGALVWAFLALGHFADGSDPGMPSGRFPGLPMPGEVTPLHPVAIYAALAAVVLSMGAYAWLTRSPYVGETAGLTLLLGGLAQLLLTFLRQPAESSWLGLDPAEWTALSMFALGGLLFARRRERSDALEA